MGAIVDSNAVDSNDSTVTVIADSTDATKRVTVTEKTPEQTDAAMAVRNILDTSHVDPFGRQRVVEPTSIFESLFTFDKAPLVWDEVLATGGTSTWNTNTRSVDMLATTASGSSVIRQTKIRVRYNPGRSVQIQISANIGAPKANCRRRLGQFDANNGLFFELDGLTPNVVSRSSTSGSVVETKVAQSAWNIDKFDGTGASGITIDFSKHQLFVIEYGWQGIANVRFGFYLNGMIKYCHSIESSNTATVPYMATATLPLRTEITNTAATASNTTLSNNCWIVKNEGEDSDREGKLRSFNSSVIKTVATTVTPVFSLRLNSTYISGVVNLIKAAIYAQTGDDVIWEIYMNATLTGATYATSRGYLDIDTASTALTGGDLLDSGFVYQANSSELSSANILSIVNSIFGATIAGVSDVITIAARSRNTSADVLYAATWREF